MVLNYWFAKAAIMLNVIAQKYNLEICTFGHAGDGNLHPTCMTDAMKELRINVPVIYKM